MDNTDREQFAEIMGGLAENFGDTLSIAGMELRFKAMQSFSIEQVGAAAMSILQTRKYTKMPTVADFIEHINGGSVEDFAAVEASKVYDAIGQVGIYNNVVFDDPVTQAVVQQGFGGWQKLCGEMKTDQQQWFLKDFAKTYAAYARRGVKHYGILPGIFGDKTKYVGDKGKCAQIASKKNQGQMVGDIDLQKLIPEIDGILGE